MLAHGILPLGLSGGVHWSMVCADARMRACVRACVCVGGGLVLSGWA